MPRYLIKLVLVVKGAASMTAAFRGRGARLARLAGRLNRRGDRVRATKHAPRGRCQFRAFVTASRSRQASTTARRAAARCARPRRPLRVRRGRPSRRWPSGGLLGREAVLEGRCCERSTRATASFHGVRQACKVKEWAADGRRTVRDDWTDAYALELAARAGAVELDVNERAVKACVEINQCVGCTR